MTSVSPRLPLAVCLSLLLISICSVAAAVEPSSWNQWRGPNRDGTINGEAAWPARLNGSLQVAWKVSLQPSYSGPVTVDGMVFTTETIDKQFERVSAYDLRTGEQTWERQWEGSMSVPFFAAANGDWIRSTPACVSGYLVVLGMRDVLVCLNTDTGEERWRVDFPAEHGSELQPFGAASSPLIHNGSVYVQVGAGLAKLSLETGQVQWKVLGGGADMSSKGAFSSPTIATIAGLEQLLVQTREELCGVSLQDGGVLWKEPIEAFRGMNILTPLPVKDAIFTAAHSGKSQLFDLGRDGDSWTVDERWNQKTQGYMSSPVLVGDHIYLHLKNERFTCLSVEDGSIQWTSSPVGKYWSMVQNKDRLLSLSADGKLRLIAASPEEYNVIDEKDVAEDSWAHLAVVTVDDSPMILVRALNSLTAYRWNIP
ncbi:PQQ-binding-like beta-propeller repeat protein [Rhodopirellula halodulae]|uniref:PQQ-binding-like beta-propeller repeat protein n=1 Tax=Rhodopirellula halodulae TaxID=2894198 RepID=UPI001E435FD9|nr:PQQ-binding-like beta-propeller repeat protein [Rhodopirellula sp. JC737]MCC9657954.1 PQQ-binding-like beta-propeller repeat protein [Rhodopirellula sp. JC737]